MCFPESCKLFLQMLKARCGEVGNFVVKAQGSVDNLRTEYLHLAPEGEEKLMGLSPYP